MDPLSVTASVISVIQAAQAVISICCDYRSCVKGSSWEVSRILEDTRSLRSILQNLEGLADKAEASGSAEQSRLPALRSLCDPDTGILSSCFAELEELTRKLAPPGLSGSTGSKRRGLVEALSWPLKKKDTEKFLDSIARYKDTISIAIHADQIPSILAIEDATQETKVSLTLLKNDTYGRNVRDWLHAIDPHPKYAKTIEDRLPGTGAWLTDNGIFNGWKKGRDSRLWLYGIPGCGKTVLCSTAIENVLEERSMSTDKAIGVAYFYFDFNNRDQQYCDTMLRSLTSQLWLQDREDVNAVDALYSACGSGASQPSSTMLKNALKELVQSFGDTFIILDALDECKERQRLMPSIEEMAVWEISSLHMLFTSRKERDIKESLSTILDDEQRICIQSALVEDDIRNYVRSRLRSDYELRRWQKPEVQTEIETVLMEKAGGMFQWVKCQLDALGRCLSLSSLRKALRSLPKDLDDTYARILQSIDDEHSKLVATIVQWLAYSEEPMSLAEISEALIVDPDDDHQFDLERRLEDPQDLLRICSSLVTTVPRRGGHLASPGSGEITSALILEGADVNAADRWCRTPLMKMVEHQHERIELVQLLLKHGTSINARTEHGDTALMLAASRGNLQTVRVLLEYGADPYEHYRYPEATALTYATGEGHSRVVDHLFDRGLPTSSPPAVTALQIACLYRQHETLRIFLARGVDVDAELHQTSALIYVMGISVFKTALLQALEVNYKGIDNDVTDLLLEYGADVNGRSTVEGSRGVALEHALNHGKDSMVKFLLDHGADPSLVEPEHLNDKGMRRYEERFLKNESQNSSMRVQKEEMEEAVADV